MHIFHKGLDLASESTHRNLQSVSTVLIRRNLYTVERSYSDTLACQDARWHMDLKGNKSGLKNRATAKQKCESKKNEQAGSRYKTDLACFCKRLAYNIVTTQYEQPSPKITPSFKLKAHYYQAALILPGLLYKVSPKAA